MDPITPAANVSAPEIAVLFGLTMAIVEVLRTAVQALAKRFSGDSKTQVILKMDPEVARQISDIDHEMGQVTAIVTRVDADGKPLVYQDRVSLREISLSQERLAAALDRIEARLDKHAQEDSRVFDSLQRVADENNELLKKMKWNE